MVFYLKYRPQKIADLDLDSVRGKLSGIVSSGRIPHAFLFVGPKGTGKTSAARIIAKIINCQQKELGARNLELGKGKTSHRYEPCNKCDACKSITNGSSLDVIEIDAASNRGIDEIRSLKERIKLSPASLQAKVYIVDEVHMLTAEAFNALLKTLEEPPSHAYFILATTEPQKLPETITSRCFIVEFQRASDEEILTSLTRVAKGEKIDVAREVLSFIAQRCQGSFRDAVKILEEVNLAKKEKRLLQQDVERVLGVLSHAEDEFLQALERKKTDKALEIIQELILKGANLSLFTHKVIDRLHIQLLSLYGVGKNDEKINLGSSQLIFLLRLLSNSLLELKRATIASLPLEMAVVEWGEKKIKNQESKIKNDQIKKDPEVLDELIKAIKPHNHSIAGVLRSCRKLTREDDTFIIGVTYQFHYERLSQPKVKELLGSVLGKLYGRKVKVEVKHV